VVFDGSGTQILTPGTSGNFYTLVNNSTGTVRLAGNPLVTTNTFTNASGTFDALTNSLAHTVTNLATVSGGNYQSAGAGVTHTFNGGLTVSGGTFTANAGTVTQTGAANSLSVSVGTFSGSTGAVNATNVSLSGGTLIAPSGLFSVTGNWAQSNGTFTPGANTVTFAKTSGTQTISVGSGGTAVSNSAFNNIDHTGAGVLQILTSSAPVTTGGTFTNELTAGNFDANGNAHTVNGLATINGGSYLAKTAVQTFNGGLTLNGGTFTASSGTVTQTGALNEITISGGTFTGSTGTVNATNLLLGSGTLTAPTGAFNISGNWTYNGGTFAPGTGTVTFNGSSETVSQVIGGMAPTAFYGLTIANSNSDADGGAGATLIDGNQQFKTVSGALTLTSGVLTTDSADMLVLGSGATAAVTAGINLAANTNYYAGTSYVNGPMQWSVGTNPAVTYTFPVGKKGIGYMPISISGINGGPAQVFGAEYYHTSAESFGPVGVASPQLIHVSGCDYWRLELLPSGTTYAQSVANNANTALPSGTANITMYFNPNSSGAPCVNTGSASVPFSQYVSSTGDLAIGHLQFVTGESYAGEWYPEASGSSAYTYSGTVSNGSIYYAGASTFSPFSLSTINGSDNPLLVKLDYFTAAKANGYNKLAWKAECAGAAPASFVLERSSDGMHFAGIDSVTADNATDCSVPFTYNDYGSSGPRVYYRVKMVDVMGNATYSETRLILNDANSFELLGIKPNPVQGEAWLSISASQSDKIELVLLSIDGREIQRKTVLVPAGSTTVNLETAQLAKGMYIIRGIFSGGQTNTIPFIKQ